MDSEQQSRFESIRQLVGQAEEALQSIQSIAQNDLAAVENDSAKQAEQLQRMQQYAGSAVDALQQTSDLARHARSYQAQAHQRHSGNKPQ